MKLQVRTEGKYRRQQQTDKKTAVVLFHTRKPLLSVERKVCKYTCTLNLCRKRSLVFRTVTGDTAGEDLSSFCHISSEHVGILVICYKALRTKLTDLLLERSSLIEAASGKTASSAI